MLDATESGLWSDKQLLDNLTVAFVAGQENPQLCLVSTLYLLAKHPVSAVKDYLTVLHVCKRGWLTYCLAGRTSQALHRDPTPGARRCLPEPRNPAGHAIPDIRHLREPTPLPADRPASQPTGKLGFPTGRDDRHPQGDLPGLQLLLDQPRPSRLGLRGQRL